MQRVASMLMVALMVLSAAVVYQLKYDAAASARNIRSLQTELDRANARSRELIAEHAFRSSNEWLQQVADANAAVLGLGVAQAAQFGSLASIPQRPAATTAAGTL